MPIAFAFPTACVASILSSMSSSSHSLPSIPGWRHCQRQILIHLRVYERACVALKSVGTADNLSFYKKLEERDLVVVKDITMAKRFGQGSESPTWIWRIGPAEGSVSEKWMEECEWKQLILFFN